MTVPGNLSSPLLATAAEAAAAAGVATKSLRFNNADSANLSRTFSSAGNRKTWTWAGWVKRSTLGTGKYGLFGGSGTNSMIRFNNDNGGDQLRVLDSATGGYDLITDRKFRDVSSWYHIGVAIDTTQSTAADRVKIYVNGVEETSFASSSYPTQNAELTFNNNISHTVGTAIGSIAFDGYLADVYFIDGLAISPVDNFIELDDNGVYQARAYAGTFGTNGFHLSFSDATSNAALGTDSSGNDNTFTVNNLVAAASSGTNYTNISTLAALSGSTLDSSYNDVSKVFDGSGTGVRTVSEVSNQGEKLSITFSPTITLSSETVSIDTSSTYQGMFVTVDGSNGSRVSGSDSNTTTLTTGSLSGSLSKITVDNGTDTSGRPASILRIRIGGTELRDPVDAKEVDALFDAPTNGSQSDTGEGGEVSGNYCTINPLSRDDSIYYTEDGNLVTGNNSVSSSSSGSRGRILSTIGFKTGKWYAEVQTTAASDGDTDFAVGIFPVESTGYYSTSGHYALRPTGHLYSPDGIHQSYGTGAWTDDDIIGIAVDMDSSTKTIQWFKNGTAIASATTIVDNEYFFGYGSDGGGGSRSYKSTWNFGQRAFAYTAPSGHKPLCTTNLPTPTIADGSDHFNAVLRNGFGTSGGTVTVGFSPGLLWEKTRSTTGSHYLYDAVRGAGKILFSNSANAESTDTDQVNAFTSTGYTLGTNEWSTSTTLVGWAWKGGSSTVSNTDGSLTSSVSANQTAGFSIVSYTSDSSATKTVGHGLGSAPKMIIFKSRDNATNWFVHHNDGSTGRMFEGLNTTNSGGTNLAAMNSTLPSSSVFSLNSGGYAINPSGNKKQIAYCFAPVEGYSAIGSYEGNSASGYPDADGPFVYTGMRPAFVLLKDADASENWVIYDTARSTYNVLDDQLYPNATTAETSGANREIDVYSNGFKIRSNGGFVNSSGNTYIYYAVAENPFQANGGLAR